MASGSPSTPERFALSSGVDYVFALVRTHTNTHTIWLTVITVVSLAAVQTWCAVRAATLPNRVAVRAPSYHVSCWCLRVHVCVCVRNYSRNLYFFSFWQFILLTTLPPGILFVPVCSAAYNIDLSPTACPVQWRPENWPNLALVLRREGALGKQFSQPHQP